MRNRFNRRRFIQAVEKRIVDTSFRDVAQASGVPRTTLSRIVEGKVVKLDTVLKLCDWMGVPFSDFFVED